MFVLLLPYLSVVLFKPLRLQRYNNFLTYANIYAKIFLFCLFFYYINKSKILLPSFQSSAGLFIFFLLCPFCPFVHFTTFHYFTDPFPMFSRCKVGAIPIHPRSIRGANCFYSRIQFDGNGQNFCRVAVSLLSLFKFLSWHFGTFDTFYILSGFQLFTSSLPYNNSAKVSKCQNDTATSSFLGSFLVLLD